MAAKRSPVLRSHVGRDVGQRVAVRPHHQPAVLVERGRGADLLPPADDAAGHEVAHRACLGGREGLGAAVGDVARARAGPPAATPVIAVVAVEIRPDRRCPWCRLAVLAPVVEAAAGDVEFLAVRVDHEHDPDLTRVDDVRDSRVVTVAIDEPVHDREGHLGGHVLVGVVPAVEHDLGLGLVDADVVRDLDRPDVAALVALADREAMDDVGVRGGQRGDLGGHLGVAVVAGPSSREFAGGRHGRRQQDQQGGDEGGDGARSPPGGEMHRSSMTARGESDHPPEGPSDAATDVPVPPGPGYASLDDRLR